MGDLPLFVWCMLTLALNIFAVKSVMSSEITRGIYKAIEITSKICTLHAYFFSNFLVFRYYNMLHISSLSFLTSRIIAINLIPIKFFSKENIWLLVVSREKSIFKSFRVLERIKANTISTILKEISDDDIQNLLNLCIPCIFVNRNLNLCLTGILLINCY